MNINNYYEELNRKTKQISEKTILYNSDFLGFSHHYIAFFGEFSELISDNNEKDMIKNFAGQLEYANISLVNGLYRQAYTSLRLSLELALATIYFSTNKLEFHEWRNGIFDIRWAKISDKENGVLSKRFFDAFFVELSANVLSLHDNSVKTYRELSEFVHGNNHTWLKLTNDLEYKEDLVEKYIKWSKVILETISITMCCRYLRSNDIELTENIIDFLNVELQHIAPIRECLGGVKDE